MAKKHIFKALMVAALAVLGLVFASIALAQQPPVSQPPEIKQTSTQTIRVGNGPVFSGDSFSRGKVHILTDATYKAGTEVNSPRCFWTKGSFINSGHGVGGLQYFRDPVPGKLCPNRYSPTGWVKVAGGTTGRKCYNPASVGQPPKPLLKGRIVLVQNFNVQVHVRAFERYSVKASCGSASGEALAEAWITVRQVVRTRGKIVGRFFGQIKARAWAKVRARLSCVPVQPPPVTPPVVTFRGEAGKFVLSSDGNTVVTGKYVDRLLPLRVFVNGVHAFTTTIRINGIYFSLSSDGRNVFRFASGAGIQVCEDLGSPAMSGLTPDRRYLDANGCAPAQTATKDMRFTFVNREVPPPPPPVTPSQPTPTPQQPTPPVTPPPPTPPSGKVGEQPPAIPAPTQGPTASPTPPSQSSAPPGGNTSQCQDPNNTASCQAPPD